jgi:hypothetical protein
VAGVQADRLTVNRCHPQRTVPFTVIVRFASHGSASPSGCSPTRTSATIAQKQTSRPERCEWATPNRTAQNPGDLVMRLYAVAIGRDPRTAQIPR